MTPPIATGTHSSVYYYLFGFESYFYGIHIFRLIKESDMKRDVYELTPTIQALIINYFGFAYIIICFHF